MVVGMEGEEEVEEVEEVGTISRNMEVVAEEGEEEEMGVVGEVVVETIKVPEEVMGVVDTKDRMMRTLNKVCILVCVCCLFVC